MTEPILRVRGLNKHFGGIVVADDISLDVGAGDILGLIGPNGAGKTSLFNLLTGHYRQDAGRIWLGGTAIDTLPMFKRARLGLSRTWQHMRLFQSMTVLDNLLISASEYRGDSMLRSLLRPKSLREENRRSLDRASGILARLGLDRDRDKCVSELTFGQQKLIGMGRALMHGGSCLLLDEPMAGVEGAAYETMKEVVREEARRGRAICVVEHNVSFIRDLCNSAVFMFNGRMMRSGSVAELLASEELSQLYFGK